MNYTLTFLKNKGFNIISEIKSHIKHNQSAVKPTEPSSQETKVDTEECTFSRIMRGKGLEYGNELDINRK